MVLTARGRWVLILHVLWFRLLAPSRFWDMLKDFIYIYIHAYIYIYIIYICFLNEFGTTTPHETERPLSCQEIVQYSSDTSQLLPISRGHVCDWDALLLLGTPANHPIQKMGKSIVNDVMKTRYSDLLYLKIYIAPMLRQMWGNS